jgi:hypothetical protein
MRSLRKILRTCSRKSPKALRASEEQLFLYSKPLEDVYPKPANSFTIMPCRVPLQYHIVQAAVEHLYSTDIVRQIMNEGNLNDSDTILDSPIGRYSTLIYPECLPERLETVTLIIEGGTLYDGML